MNLVKDMISILTALMLTSSSIAGPYSIPAVEEAVSALPLEEVAEKVEEYDAALETLAVFETANVLSGTEIIAAHASDIAGNASAQIGTAAGFGETRDDESQWYCPGIPMKKEHQKLLWECCRERGLDYIDMLALISLESNFDEKCSSGKYKGYFQISADYGPELSKTLGTENKPLDGAVNIRWGTAFYSWILQDERVKDKEGKEQRDIALSIYQRGSGGYDRKGLSTSYLAKYYKKREKIISYFER